MNKNSSASPKTPGSQHDEYRGEELPASDTHLLPQPQPLDNTSGTSHGSKTVGVENVSKAFQTDDVIDVLLDSRAESGPFDGGCLIVARALQNVYGGELVYLHSEVGVEHYGVRLPNGTYLDADGVANTEEEWISRFQEAELVDREMEVRDGYAAGEALDDPQAVKKLTKILRKTAGITASIVRGRDEADHRMSMDDVLRGLNASMLDGGRPPACSAFNTIKQRKIK